MKIVDLSVRRPITIFMITLIAVFLGVFSYMNLTIDLMPDITYPIITVQTDYEGVSPQDMETSITQPIEEVVGTVEGMEKLSSMSMEGRSVVRVSFKWGQSLEEASNDISAKINRIRDRLPEDASSPIISKFDLNAAAIMWVGVSGRMSRVKLRTIAERELKRRFERINGLAQASIVGGLEREIHVDLRYDDLQKRNISIDDVINALQMENIDQAAGDVYVRGQKKSLRYVLRTSAKFKSMAEIRDIIIKRVGEIPVVLSELADVTDTHKDVKTFVRVNGENALLFRLVKQPDANTVEVARKLRREVEKMQSDPSIHVDIQITRDLSTYIKRSITNVQQAGMFGGIIAILVLIIFLRNLRSTFIIAVSMIVSIISTFIFMKGTGFTLNMMTFGGLALGIGMLVDNSVVVIENIFRHRAENTDPIEASRIGTREVSNAITISTITTAVVFLPLFYVEGTTGIMFRQLAFMVSFSLVSSLIVALTIIPAFSSRFLKNQKESRKNGIMVFLDNKMAKVLESLEISYTQVLNTLLNHKIKSILSFIIFVSLISLLVHFIGFDYMPTTDEGEIRINGDLEVGTSVGVTDKRFRLIEKVIKEDFGDSIDSMFTRIGRGGYRRLQEHSGYMNIILTDLGERKNTSKELAEIIKKRLLEFPEIREFVRFRVRSRSLFLLRMLRGGEDRISLELRGHDLKKGKRLAEKIKAKLIGVKGVEGMEGIKGITDLRISREEGNLEYTVNIDRRQARDLGLSSREIADFLQTANLGKVATQYSDGEYQHDILVRLKQDKIKDLDAIKNLTYFVNGRKIKLKNLIHIKKDRGPSTIERLNQERVIYINGGIAGRDSQAILKDIKKAISSIDMPESYYIRYGGVFEEQEKAYSELLLGIVLAVCLVYMVMAAQFESFKAPLVIMFTVPMAFGGVILIFYLTKTLFDVQAFIGSIMLTGIVVNNSIVLVDFIQQISKRSESSVREAIVEAGSKRLRPILMTSLTTICALIPLAIGIGEGSELQIPMALAVIGGLSFSTLISLFLIPCIYLLFFKK